jgi:hypothetical protein
MVVNHGGSQDSGDRNAVGAGVAIGEDNDTILGLNSGSSLIADVVEVGQVALNALRLGKGQVNGLDSPARVGLGHVLDGIKLGDG